MSLQTELLNEVETLVEQRVWERLVKQKELTRKERGTKATQERIEVEADAHMMILANKLADMAFEEEV